jgi:hypothetical protein
MAQDPRNQKRPLVAKAEQLPDEGHGIDRMVTAVAFLATVALILFSWQF